ncbi:hypothetical protein N9N67_11080 [Bacteriovoracaceae bacterium]|nr:hypothetical protein [Bacteriovoracaceae bacterium]
MLKKCSKKSSVNPWHRLIYKGIDTDLLYSIMNQFCPVELAPKSQHIIGTYGDSSHAWQSKEKHIGWEVGDGHDCIFLLNSLIANLKKNIEFGQMFEKKSCPKNKNRIGQYQTGTEPWDVCHYSSFKTSMTKCHSKSGVIRYKHPVTEEFVPASSIVESGNGAAPDFTKMKDQQAYCLEKKTGYFKAKKINKVCGFGRKLIGYYNTKEQRSLWNTSLSISSVYSPHLYPICSPILKKKIRLSKCFKHTHIIPIIEVLRGTSSEENKDVSYCLVSKGSYFVKKDISRNCPFGTKDTGKKKVAWRWPICKPWIAKKISVEDCLKESPDHGHEQGYCIWAKGGYFKGRPIKDKNVLNESDEIVNSEDERNNFKTIPKRWTIQNNFSFNDFLDNVDPNELVDIRMQGTLTWKTLGDRKGDYFYVKVFRIDNDSEVELINTQNNLPGLFENVDVLFNRSEDEFIRIDNQDWDGNYSLDYNLSLLYDTPHIELKYKVYLVEVEDNGSETTTLAFEHRQNIISRSNSILDKRKIVRVYPNPFTNLSDIKIDLLSNMTNDSDQNNNTL